MKDIPINAESMTDLPVRRDGRPRPEKSHRSWGATWNEGKDLITLEGSVTEDTRAMAVSSATGVEMAAELYRSTRTAVACGLDKIDPAEDLHITLIEANPRIFAAPPERLSKSAEELLCGLDMHMLTGARITTKSARRRRSLPS
jgi:hypothetical protein